MVAVPSTMLSLGTKAPDFNLPSTIGKSIALSDFKEAKGYLIIFLSNHCPYVHKIREKLASLTSDYRSKGIAIFGINSTDDEQYPEETMDKMIEEVAQYGYSFSYLKDDSQEVAKAYCAACTPDFFLFDQNKKLVYRGQFDSSRPGNDKPVTGENLKFALDTLLDKNPPIPNDQQIPSIGCNIKWKPGNAPDYFKNR